MAPSTRPCIASYAPGSWPVTGQLVNGRRRRVYHLTPTGRTALAEQQRSWQGFSGAVQSVLKGVPWPNPS